MQKINIGISEKNLTSVVQILNQLLADEYLLYTKTRNFHWNVTGPHFGELHKFFENQYEELDEIIDEVAERARSLGGIAAGSMAEFLKLTSLKETKSELIESKKMIANLLEDHQTIIRSLRESVEKCGETYKDAGTSDFLTGIMEQHEKFSWMLRSFL